MQIPKARNNPMEAPQKVSPRVVCQLKTTTLETSPASSSSPASRTQKDRSPKVAAECRSPRSPASEPQKKRPSRISELESQISLLQEDLKKAKDQLSSPESWKMRAEQEAKDSKKQLLDVSSKLEESQKQLSELSASEEAHIAEIHQLKIQLETVTECEAAQSELQGLKENLAETLSHVEDMKNRLRDCKESEAQAQALVSETLLQLETAKKPVETLRLDGMKITEAYDSITSELERVESLEGLVHELNSGGEIMENGEIGKSMQLEAELTCVKDELGQLRTALETAEVKYHEEQIESTLKIRSANELVEQIKSESSVREVDLEAELNKTKAEVEELKANWMDKETELQGISEENEGLHMKLEKRLPCKREYELEKELKKSKEDVADLKANLMDKETELQNISEENEMLKLESKGWEMDKGKANNEIVSELEAARAAERGAYEARLHVGGSREKQPEGGEGGGAVGGITRSNFGNGGGVEAIEGAI